MIAYGINSIHLPGPLPSVRGEETKGIVFPLKELTVRLEAMELGAEAQEEVRNE